MSTEKPIVSLNLLRGLAALSVCIFHILSGDSLKAIPWLNAIFSRGYLGLDLFFIISGFIIPYSMYQNRYSFPKFPKFLLKRSCRIEPPYIISFLLIILVRIMYDELYDFTYTQNWPQFFLHFCYLNQYFGYEPYTTVYWTLAIEFQFYIIIGFVFPLLIHKNKLYPFLVFSLFGTFCWFLNLHYNWFIFQYGYLFLSGMLLFLYKIKNIPIKAFVCLLSVLLFTMYFKNGIDVLLTTIFAMIAILNINRSWKVTDFFGKISYSFYLVHLEATGWYMLFLRGTIKDEWLLKISAIVFAILFATGFYYLFELPALRFSKKIRLTD